MTTQITDDSMQRADENEKKENTTKNTRMGATKIKATQGKNFEILNKVIC